MTTRYIPPSTIGPATDSRKPTAFESIKMWWDDGASSRASIFGYDGTVIKFSNQYNDDDYLSDMQKYNDYAIKKAKDKNDKKNKEINKIAEDLLIKDKIANKELYEKAQREGDITTMESARDFMNKTFDQLDATLKAQYLEKAKANYGKPTTTTPLNIAPQPGTTPPVRTTEGAITTQGQQPTGGSNGAGVVATPPQKNLANQYTFANGHKEFDPSKIPEVLQGGKITPARYFAQNGMNWFKDSKRIANEMGMTGYRGTPGENYAMVQYLEDKKNGVTQGNEGGTPGKKFDGIQTQEEYRRRFSAEDTQNVMSMTEDERNKYLAQRDITDLKDYMKKNKGNLALMNKVLGTNYTDEDVYGGPAGVRSANMLGKNQTPAMQDIDNRIAKLNHGDAKKWMGLNGELDQGSANDVIIKTNPQGTASIQTGRQQILKDIVDGKRTKDGTSIDANDQQYMDDYRDYKLEQQFVSEYNSVIQQYNSIDGKNVLKPKALGTVGKFLEKAQKENPRMYEKYRAELDRVPGVLQSGGTVKTLTAPTEKVDNTGGSTSTPTTKNVPTTTIAPPKTYNNLTPNSDTNTATPDTNGTANTNQLTTEQNKESQGPMPILKDEPVTTKSSSGGGYSRYENEPSIGYSSNSISRG